MSPTDWPQIDSNAAAIQSAMSTSDLFGGELFGDELMDMYNSTAVVDPGSADAAIAEIPPLLPPPTSSPEALASVSQSEPSSSPETAHAGAATSDDGLGAFRPSTSFNDLASLLPSQEDAPPPPPVLSETLPSASEKPSGSPTKKRGRPKGSLGSDAAQKRRITTSTGGKSNQSNSQMTQQKGSNLRLGKGVSHSVSPKLDHLKVKQEKKTTTNNPIAPTNQPLSVKAGLTSDAISLEASVVTPAVVTPGAAVRATVPSNATINPDTSVSVAASANSNAVPMVTTSMETTQDNFKGVAQAAVTNLILTAGATAKNKPSALAPVTDSDSDSTGKLADDVDNGPVNTSSSHIAALTSSNWVAACSASVAGGAPGTVTAAQAAALAAAAASASDPAAVKANRARRANLSPDERAKQNRDRNREHARNTRLRKKAYIEELKRTLTELVAQRDAANLERRHEAQRTLEVREVRFRVMEEFLKLRSRGDEGNSLLARWVAILEDGFTLTLPSTPYRSMVRNGVASKPNPIARAVSIEGASNCVTSSSSPASEQILNGATEALEDATHMSSFFNSVIESKTSAETVRFAYNCDRKHFLLDGCNAVLNWTAATAGLVGQGGQSEMAFKGSLRATFSPASNKLIAAEMMFDTASVSSQLRLLTSPAVTNAPSVVAPAPCPSTTISLAADTCDAVVVAAAAAASAANEADALLDSLQMPRLAAVSMLPAISIGSENSEEPPAGQIVADPDSTDDSNEMMTV